MPVEELQALVERLQEVNPMLGLRGCRLGIIYPEITAMQVRAIFEAACTVASRKGRVMPEVMIPLTASVVEFRKQALIVRQVAEEVFRERQITVPFLLGTMIELPRACVTADELAREAQFFSFGTNDLTQTTWGLTRDDAGHFLPYYLEHGVIEDDPFQVLDQAGVGKLIGMACELGRRTRHDLKLGICGEHGGRAGRGGLLRQAGDELRHLLALPGADRPAGGGAGRAGRAGHDGPHPGHGVDSPHLIPRGARDLLGIPGPVPFASLGMRLPSRFGRRSPPSPPPSARSRISASNVSSREVHRLHLRGYERPPAGQIARVTGAAGLERGDHRLTRLVDADQVGFDHPPEPLVDQIHRPVVQCRPDQMLRGREVGRSTGGRPGIGLLAHHRLLNQGHRQRRPAARASL